MEFLRKINKNVELKERIFITILFIILFRVLSFIPVPFISRDALRGASENGLFAYASMFSGGALANFTLMATGISSYISASILMQLMTYASEKLHNISRTPGGDKQIKKMTIIIGIVIAFITSIVMTSVLNQQYQLLTKEGPMIYLLIAVIHAAGTGIAVWIGETITEKGFGGNGVSLLIFINIISGFPNSIRRTRDALEIGTLTNTNFIICIVVLILVLIAIVISESSIRKVPINYSRAGARGSTSFVGTRGFFPIKLNLTGIMPIIIASTLMQIIIFIGSNLKGQAGEFMVKYFSYGAIPYSITLAVFIFLSSYMFSALMFNPREISNNIQNSGGVIPGVRPGIETGKYIEKINKSLTFLGALYLSIIALIPTLLFSRLGFDGIATTSMIILVGVSLETAKKIKIEAEIGILETF